MPPAQRLHTPRCLLRLPERRDVPALFAHLSGDPQVTRYLGWKTHQNERETHEQLIWDLHRWPRAAAWTWVIELQGAPVGLIQALPQGHQARLGFLLAWQVWGQGLANEVLFVLTEALFALPELYRLDAVCDVDNLASARVLEKAGMQREGCLRRYSVHPNISEQPRDVFLYARIKA